MTTAENHDHDGRVRRNRAIEEVRRWASFVLIVIVLVLGYYVNKSTVASDRAAAASEKAAAASDRAATAAGKASSDLAAAIAASNNPDQTAAIFHALQQIDDIEKILCIEHGPACDQVLGQPDGTPGG